MAKDNNLKDFFVSLKNVILFKNGNSGEEIKPTDVAGIIDEITPEKYGTFQGNITCYMDNGVAGVKSLFCNYTGEMQGYAYERMGALQIAFINEGVTAIGEYGFRECTNLNQVILPKTLKKINEYAFQKCTSLLSINGLENVEYIGRYALIGTALLRNCGTGPIYLGKNNLYLYEGNTPEKITLQDNTTSISPGAIFDKDGLKTLECTTHKLIINSMSISNTSIEAIYIYSNDPNGEGVSIIGMGFFNSTKLKKVYIENVKYIAGNAFTSSIKEFYFLNEKIPSDIDINISNYKTTATIYVRPALLNEWKTILDGYNVVEYTDSNYE